MYFVNQINVTRALLMKFPARSVVSDGNKANLQRLCRCFHVDSCFEGTRQRHASRLQPRANSPNVRCYSSVLHTRFAAGKQIQAVDPFRTVGLSLRSLCSSSGAEEPWNCFHQEMVQRVKNGDATIIDVRRVDEIQETGMMEGAHNIPLDELKQAFELPGDKFEKLYGIPLPEGDGSEMIFHCRSGVRSLKALNIARECGFTEARHYPGGWLQWAEENKL